MIKRLEEYLEFDYFEVRQGLNVLAGKSLISFNHERSHITMNILLVKLGKEIVRKHEPWQRRFLFDRGDIRDVLTDDAACRENLISIEFEYFGIGENVHMSATPFEGMDNLKYLRIKGGPEKLQFSPGLETVKSFPGKLRLLHWSYSPMSCFPSNVRFEFLVELFMHHSRLEKLWKGTKILPHLKRVRLGNSVKLKKIPDMSTAIKLQELNLSNCSSLSKLHSSIGNAKNLEILNLGGCSSLVELHFLGNAIINLTELYLSSCSNLLELPYSICKATNLKKLFLSGCSSLSRLPSDFGKANKLEELDLSDCSNLVEVPFSIGKCKKLKTLFLRGCSKLEVLPTNINLESLDELDLTNCSKLKTFPEISANVKVLKLRGTAIEEISPLIRSRSRLNEFHLSYFENLENFPHAFNVITHLYLTDTKIQEVPPWVKGISRLTLLVLKGCRKLVSLPQTPDSLSRIDAEGCESLERLDCSFKNPKISLSFAKCFKLSEGVRDLIIQTSIKAILPGTQVPEYFTHRATGDSLTIKLSESILPASMRFKACVFMVYKKGDDEPSYDYNLKGLGYRVTCENNECFLRPILTEHLYTFEVEREVDSSELLFKFKQDPWNYCNGLDWEIRACGIRQF